MPGRKKASFFCAKFHFFNVPGGVGLTDSGQRVKADMRTPLSKPVRGKEIDEDDKNDLSIEVLFAPLNLRGSH